MDWSLLHGALEVASLSDIYNLLLMFGYIALLIICILFIIWLFRR